MTFKLAKCIVLCCYVMFLLAVRVCVKVFWTSCVSPNLSIYLSTIIPIQYTHTYMHIYINYIPNTFYQVKDFI